MSSVYNYFSHNVGFFTAVSSCLLIVFGLAPYHQSVNRTLTVENGNVYSITLDLNSRQIESLLQNALLCVYNSERVHLYNFLSPASSPGYECSPINTINNLARIENGLRIKLFAKTSYRLRTRPDTTFKAKIIMGEVPLAYELWRRLTGHDVSKHKEFERPKPTLPEMLTTSALMKD